MSISCILGHKWDGCKCLRCGKNREEGHDWSKDCETCSICHTKRQNMHDWSKDCETCSICHTKRQNMHDWSKDCETCSVCNTKRQNMHDWSKDCETCSICGKKRNGFHDWHGCKCKKCNVQRDSNHIWHGCTCTQCGKTRDKDHIWENGLCQQCGKIFEEPVDSTPMSICDTCDSATSEETRKELIDAIINKQSELVKTMLDTRINVNFQTDDGDTPLLFAAWKGHIEIVKMLIKYNADVNIRNVRGESALSIAVLNDHTDVAEELVSISEDKLLKEVAYNIKMPDSLFQTLLLSGGKHSYEYVINEITRKGYYTEWAYSAFEKVSSLGRMNEPVMMSMIEENYAPATIKMIAIILGRMSKDAKVPFLLWKAASNLSDPDIIRQSKSAAKRIAPVYKGTFEQKSFSDPYRAAEYAWSYIRNFPLFDISQVSMTTIARVDFLGFQLYEVGVELTEKLLVDYLLAYGNNWLAERGKKPREYIMMGCWGALHIEITNDNSFWETEIFRGKNCTYFGGNHIYSTLSDLPSSFRLVKPINRVL